MQLFAVLTADKEGLIPTFGKVDPLQPLVIDQYKMIRIEAKHKLKFFEIPLPVGVWASLHILDDDKADFVLQPKG